MSVEIKVPVLGESVVEATVAKWMKVSGEAVKADEAIVELETDKVTLEVPSPVNGVLSDIVATEGATVGVDALLGLVEEGAASSSSASPKAEKLAVPDLVAPALAPSAKVSAVAQVMPLSPAVRKLVDENNLDPKAIVATGKDGRLTKADVLGAIEKGVAAPVAQTTAASAQVAPRVADNREERVPMSRLRRLIASRLKEAQNTAAMLTTFNEVDMSDVMALRSEDKEEFEKTHGARLGFMGFFVKAVISALREYPAVNA